MRKLHQRHVDDAIAAPVFSSSPVVPAAGARAHEVKRQVWEAVAGITSNREAIKAMHRAVRRAGRSTRMFRAAIAHADARQLQRMQQWSRRKGRKA